MPGLVDVAKFVYVNVGFVVLIAVMMYLRSADDIQQNWPKYRCNPPYWVFSTDIMSDFTYCIQNTQVNLMGYLLQPLTQLTSQLAAAGGHLGTAINDTRKSVSNIRKFTTSIIENVFGVFLNLIIEFQRMIISIRDMVGKMIGVVVAVMFVMDGSIKTMNSTWSGPPGQMVRSIGSCFHPDTRVQLADGSWCKMGEVPVGSYLADGASQVFATMKIANLQNEPLYVVGADTSDPIYVTGKHFIQEGTKFVPVNYSRNAILAPPAMRYVSDFVCMITTTGHIPIGPHVFWDWEDDVLHDES